MKRLRPQREYREHEGYPSVDELDRRAFFRQAMGAAAATVGVLASDRAEGRSRAAKPPEKVTVHLPTGTPIGKTRYRAQKLDVWTRDPRFAKFLRNSKEHPGVAVAAGLPIRKARDRVVEDGRALYRLERRIAKALTTRYRQRTRRHAASPDVMLYLTERHVRIRTGGVMIRTVRPVRRPIIRPRRTP